MPREIEARSAVATHQMARGLIVFSQLLGLPPPNPFPTVECALQAGGQGQLGQDRGLSGQGRKRVSIVQPSGAL